MRLTKSHKSQIVDVLMDRAFKDRESALDAELDSISVAVWDILVPPHEREIAASLPEGWIDTETRTIQVSVDGQAFEVAAPKKGFPIPFTINWNTYSPFNREGPFVYRSSFSTSGPPRWVSTKLAQRMLDHRNASEKLKGEKRLARAKAEALIDAVNTDKALIELWPESRLVVESIVGPPAKAPIKALAVPIESLNATFKLPPTLI
jgi:hypothetical protein